MSKWPLRKPSVVISSWQNKNSSYCGHVPAVWCRLSTTLYSRICCFLRPRLRFVIYLFMNSHFHYSYSLWPFNVFFFFKFLLRQVFINIHTAEMAPPTPCMFTIIVYCYVYISHQWLQYPGQCQPCPHRRTYNGSFLLWNLKNIN